MRRTGLVLVIFLVLIGAMLAQSSTQITSRERNRPKARVLAPHPHNQATAAPIFRARALNPMATLPPSRTRVLPALAEAASQACPGRGLWVERFCSLSSSLC